MTDLSNIQTGDLVKHPTAVFQEAGATIRGTVEASRMADIPSLREGEPPRTTLLIDVRIDPTGTTAQCRADGDRDPQDPVWTVFCKPAAMRAVALAVRQTGTAELKDGAQLAIQRGEDNESARKPGLSAPHTFTAAYQPPAGATLLPAPSAPQAFAGPPAPPTALL